MHLHIFSRYDGMSYDPITDVCIIAARNENEAREELTKHLTFGYAKDFELEKTMELDDHITPKGNAYLVYKNF